jgi:ABC-2 type transport system ATP-binding protein
LALALVLARRPRLLLLDEPLANLGPLARLEVQQTLLAEVAETGMTVLVSSHILGEVQDACDDLMLLVNGRVTLHDSIEDTLDRHLLLTGPGGDEGDLASLSVGAAVVEVRRSLRQLTVLLDGRPSAIPEGWTAAAPTIEEIVVARFRSRADVGEAAA